jgi:hypothetical protein
MIRTIDDPKIGNDFKVTHDPHDPHAYLLHQSGNEQPWTARGRRAGVGMASDAVVGERAGRADHADRADR